MLSGVPTGSSLRFLYGGSIHNVVSFQELNALWFHPTGASWDSTTHGWKLYGDVKALDSALFLLKCPRYRTGDGSPTSICKMDRSIQLMKSYFLPTYTLYTYDFYDYSQTLLFTAWMNHQPVQRTRWQAPTLSTDTNFLLETTTTMTRILCTRGLARWRCGVQIINKP